MVSGLSKTYSITGWRVGYVICDAKWSTAIGYFSDMLYACAPAPLQMGAAMGLMHLDPEFYDNISKEYQKKRDRICDALNTAGLTPFVPQGAYYVLCDISGIPGSSGEKRVMHLLKELKVASVPGEAFYHDAAGENLTRFCFAKEDAVTDFDRLRKLGNYIQDRGKLPLPGGKVLDIFQAGYTVMDLAPAKFTHAEDVLGELQMAVIKGDKDEVCENVIKCLVAKVDGRSILREGMITAMTYVGDAFGRGDMYIPEMLMAANAMEAGVELLKPALTSSLTQQTKAKVILGTVYGDLHDIGKNLVSIMLKGTGMEVIDLGINLSKDAFIRCVVDEKPDILALSALLTTTMPQMKIVIDSLEEMGIRDHIKIIVGGAPVTDNFAKSIGADGYAETAGSAAALARNIL